MRRWESVQKMEGKGNVRVTRFISWPWNIFNGNSILAHVQTTPLRSIKCLENRLRKISIAPNLLSHSYLPYRPHDRSWFCDRRQDIHNYFIILICNHSHQSVLVTRARTHTHTSFFSASKEAFIELYSHENRNQKQKKQAASRARRALSLRTQESARI